MTRRPHLAFSICLLTCGIATAADKAVAAEKAVAQTAALPTTVERAKPSMIRGEDGKIDVSNFLDQAYGFLPVVVPITEPAVGAGAVVALAFLDRPKNEDGGFNRPNISVIGALGTENGTEGYFGADSRYWLDNASADRGQPASRVASILITTAAAREAISIATRSPTPSMSLAPWPRPNTGSANHKTGWVVKYLMARTSVSFDDNRVLPLADRETNISGIGFAFTHDTRDNIFTPREGNLYEASATIFSDALGSDLNFKRYDLVGMQYKPLNNKISLGFRESFTANSGDTPFYMQPYVYMRGVPAMRYMGDKVAQVEAEVFWRAWDRVGVVGFIGAGAAANKTRDLDTSSTACLAMRSSDQLLKDAALTGGTAWPAAPAYAMRSPASTVCS